MKKGVFFLSVLFFIAALSGSIYAVSAYSSLHLNIQVTYTNGSIETGTFAFVFNISSSSDCNVSNIVYSNSTTLTTDSRGIISYYLDNVILSDYSQQYWLCYYRDGVLIDTSKLAQVPYAFYAGHVPSGGVLSNGNINISAYNFTAAYLFGNGQYLTGISGSSVTAGGNNGAIQFNSAGGLGGNESQFFINSTNGYVGIGTSSPKNALTVIQGTTPASQFQNSVAIAGIGGTSTHGILGEAASGTYWGGIFYNNNSGNEIDIAGGSYGLIVKSGNVGIGTASPANPLHINFSDSTTTQANILSGLKIQNSNSTNNTGSMLAFSTTDAAGTSVTEGRIGTINTNHNAGATSADLVFENINAGLFSEKMRITSTGNVGIGTTSPVGTLDINSSGAATNVFIRSPNSTTRSQLVFANSTGAQWAMGLGSTNSEFFIGQGSSFYTTQKLTILPSGNVGINNV
ncbi:MAG: hypothetical protein M1165_01815 [Candidatus Pacearchaeota archaeon]|nr:hypothetical protein [Candidatus Pacearchaeota archaeon]